MTLVEGAEDGQEATVGLGEVLLCLPGGGAAAVGLQERVLLNLARCLLRIADPAEDPAGVPPPSSSLRAATCRRAAVLGCSLALACGRHRAAIGGSDGNGDGDGGGNAGDAPTTEEKARLIRSAAYLALGRLRHASADARHVLARLRPGSAGAERQLARVRREARRRKRTDRRLARDVCGWVKAVTEGGAEAGTEGEGVAVEGSVQRRSRTASRFALVASPLLLAFLFACAIAAVAAWTAARDVLTAPGLTISE